MSALCSKLWKLDTTLVPFSANDISFKALHCDVLNLSSVRQSAGIWCCVNLIAHMFGSDCALPAASSILEAKEARHANSLPAWLNHPSRFVIVPLAIPASHHTLMTCLLIIGATEAVPPTQIAAQVIAGFVFLLISVGFSVLVLIMYMCAGAKWTNRQIDVANA